MKGSLWCRCPACWVMVVYPTDRMHSRGCRAVWVGCLDGATSAFQACLKGARRAVRGTGSKRLVAAVVIPARDMTRQLWYRENVTSVFDDAMRENAEGDLSPQACEPIEAVQCCFDALSASDVGKTLYASQGHGRMARWFTSSLLPRWCETREGDERQGGFDQPIRR